MIELRSVGKVYGKKEHLFTALNDITFSIESGTSVAIVGKSGSGKSTLMHVMSGLDRISSGEITIDDQNIAQLKQHELDRFRAEKIGFIFQAFFVQANETCEQNVSVPLEIRDIKKAERKARVTRALERVGLGDKAQQKAKNLSGGQKQRLAVARAIVGEPRIIFADEPTGNLDTQTGEQIEDLLFALNKDSGATLIIVTHDNELAARCDRQITIRDGKIVEDSLTREGATV
ncbi:MAG TPA: ABC transporter ATP-binding protein [Patescibacteria group bacterium]|jgi:putative ABC transport system ATP-binding protein|nr:ABC transporter ATP-binding protein [Patescibacteria group bacterium]